MNKTESLLIIEVPKWSVKWVESQTIISIIKQGQGFLLLTKIARSVALS